MSGFQEWYARIREVGPGQFDELALAVFRYQAAENPDYAEFCRLVGRLPGRVVDTQNIPFFPVAFFKDRMVQTGSWTPSCIFRSSGTTAAATSRHAVHSADWYLEVTDRGFRHAWGDPARWCWLALLPGYLERTDSSLVTMIDHFIRTSNEPRSGFFLHDVDRLINTASDVLQRGGQVMVFGVTHALLALADLRPGWTERVMVMETGGMKGFGPELIREELHNRLTAGLGVPWVASEYGMTEMLSQAYAGPDGRFRPSPTLRVTVRDIHDPFGFPGFGRTGRLCVTDLANMASVAFIQTDDLGRVWPDGTFEVLGRMDGSDLRGCNLLLHEFSPPDQDH